MEYIIAYDLADDRRRDRLVRTLLDYGKRIQMSVFAVHLDDELFDRMITRIRSVVDENEDRVHVFRLCGACEERVIMMGTGEMPSDPDFIII